MTSTSSSRTRACGISGMKGVGGIASAADVLKFFAVGAVAVQVGTAVMDDPLAIAEITSELGDGNQ